MFRTQNGRLGDFQGPAVTASGACGVGPCPVEMTGEDARWVKSYRVALEMTVGRLAPAEKPDQLASCIYLFFLLFLRALPVFQYLIQGVALM